MAHLGHADDDLLGDLLNLLDSEEAYQQHPNLHSYFHATPCAVRGYDSPEKTTPNSTQGSHPKQRNASRDRKVQELRSLRNEVSQLQATREQLEQRKKQLQSVRGHGKIEDSWQVTAVTQFDYRKKSEELNQQLKGAVEAQEKLLKSLQSLVPPGVFSELTTVRDCGQVPRNCLDRKEEYALCTHIAKTQQTYEHIQFILSSAKNEDDAEQLRKRKTEYSNGRLLLEVVDTSDFPRSINACGRALWETVMKDLKAHFYIGFGDQADVQDETVAIRFRSRYRAIAKEEVGVIRCYQDYTQDGRNRVVMIWTGTVTGDRVLDGMTAKETWVCMLEEDEENPGSRTKFKSLVELTIVNEYGGSESGYGEDGGRALVSSYEKYMDSMVARMKSTSISEAETSHPSIPQFYLFCHFGHESSEPPTLPEVV